MRQVSLWAKEHVWTTRLLIIFFIYPLLNICGWFLGAALFWNGMELPFWCALVCITVFSFLFILYPARKDNASYFRRKFFDLLLSASTFCLIVFTSNQLANRNFNAPLPVAAASSIASSYITPGKPTKTQKQGQLKKWLKKMEHKYRSAGKRNQNLYIVLTVIIGLLLIFGLSALACNVACTGSEGAAFVILFIGLAAIIFGMVRTIRRIKRGPRKKPEQNPAGS